MILEIIGLGLLLAGTAAAIIITLDNVINALRQQKICDSDIIELEKLFEQGKFVGVKGGVYSKPPLGILPRTMRFVNRWHGTKIDEELCQTFGSRTKVKLKA